MKQFLTIAMLTIIAGTSCKGQSTEPQQTVPYVDIDKYSGKWYEIASFPQRFQKGCSCTTAEYARNTDGSIKVTNTCLKDGKLKVRTAKATVEDKNTNSKLTVQFFWPFKGDYWIIELADDYSYAVVGHPSREYLWILSRTPTMDEQLYEDILNRIWNKGYNINNMQRTDQSCNK